MEGSAWVFDSMIHSGYFFPFNGSNVIRKSTVRSSWPCRRRQNYSDKAHNREVENQPSSTAHAALRMSALNCSAVHFE